MIGFGERKTPTAFIFTENLVAGGPEPAHEGSDEALVDPALIPEPSSPSVLTAETAVVIKRAAEACTDESSGWAALGNVGAYIRARLPDFDVRSYEMSKSAGLSGLMLSHPELEPHFTWQDRTKPENMQTNRRAATSKQRGWETQFLFTITHGHYKTELYI